MAKRKKRSKGDQMFSVPAYDELADKGRDTGAANRNRVVVAETRVLREEIGGAAVKRDRSATAANYSHDTIIFMLKRGKISERLAMAGCRFREQFTAALSSNVPAMDMEQAIGHGGGSPLRPGGGACSASWTGEVMPALEALGRPDSPMRLLAWHVLGDGKSLRMFAETVGWEGMRPRPIMAASGILQATLRTLADHYGLEERQ